MTKWRILVVDDDQDIRDLVRNILEPEYEVVEARDGLDALEKIERAEPDFVVLDIMMPLMDGIETCEAIRKSPRYSDLTVLFLSALGSHADIRKGYDAGANLYLTKPFDPARLKRNIDLFFEQRPDQTPPARHYTVAELQRLEDVGPEAIAAAGTAAPAAPTDAPAAPRPALRPRILVVDDEPGICAMATGALCEEFEVFCAADGIDAITKITMYQPDLVLIDTMMPRMSGYQLCQSLRQNARFARTPIILASAKQSQKDREYSLKIGADAFLQKPYTGFEVLHAAREMTEKPHFRIHPKALTAQSIQELENRKNQDQARRERVLVQRERINKMRDFIERHADE